MRYWWVNQNQTYGTEFKGNFMWSPKANANGALASALRPALDVDDRKLAEMEGWILGVG